MRLAVVMGLAAVCASGPVLAQQPGDQSATTAHPRHTRTYSGSPEKPVDHGPFTPEANSAYQGGGMVLQGAPGAPPPTPEPTPPGQTPRNMVPVR